MGGRARRRLQAIAPWAVAAAILAWIFHEVPIAAAWRAAQAAQLGLFVSGMLGAVLFFFLIESSALAYLFTRFNAPVSGAEARSLRGTTYLLTPINWNAGTAGIVLHLRRSKSIGALESTSSMLFYALIDGMVLAGFVLVGVSLLPESPAIASLRRIAAGLQGVQLVLLAALMAPAPEWSWLRRLRGLAIFRTHCLADARDLGWLVLLRCLYFAGFVGVFWLGTRAFGVGVPLLVATAATPAILAAGAIPITPAGLGTQQAAMLLFFSPYGDPAAILAFGLSYPVALTIARCLLGLAYLRDLSALRGAGPERCNGGAAASE